MILAMGEPKFSRVRTCIECGCDDLHACIDRAASVDRVVPCSWIRVDSAAGVGVCSNCPEATDRYDAGDRTLKEKN